jgi:hypothetical protein
LVLSPFYKTYRYSLALLRIKVILHKSHQKQLQD